MSQLTVLPKLFYQHTKIFGHGPYLIKIEEDHVIKKEKNCLNSINVHHCNIGKNKSLIIPQNEDSILRYTHATPILKFIYSGKATKFCKISAVDLTRKIYGGDFAKICDLFRIYELYHNSHIWPPPVAIFLALRVWEGTRAIQCDKYLKW